MPSNGHRWGFAAMACLLVALVLSVPNALKAQTTTASLDGFVTDVSGAVVPGATVELVNEGTNVKLVMKTDQRGYYFFKFLLPASYKLTVTVTGFETFVRSGMVLQVQQVARVDVALKPGTISTKVEVTGEAPRLDTADASQSQVVNLNEMLNLPGVGRNPLAFAQLSPNIVGVGGQPQGGGQNFSANGGRLDTTDVLMDGVTINSQDFNSGVHDTLFTPTSDEIQEMKVMTNTFSAEYGLSGNAIITMVSRTGTNHLHGNIFEYHSDNDLDAQSFFGNQQGAASKIPVTRSNTAGGVVGGPVYIPKVYDGRNKTFFFEHWERLFIPGNSDPITQTVPTALEKTGDFSQSYLSDGTAVTVYNPNAYNANACAYIGTPPQYVCGLRTAYPGNGSGSAPGTYIDPSTWNPIAKAVLPFYPAPTSLGQGPEHLNNFFWLGKTNYNWYEEDIRIDQNFTANQRLAVRYSRQPSSNAVSSNPWGAGNYMVGDGIYSGWTNLPQHATVNYTNVFTPTTILNLQYGIVRLRATSGLIGVPTNWKYTDFGYVSDIGVSRAPEYFMQGYADIGPSLWSGEYGGDSGNAQTTHQTSGSLTKVMGIHTFKMGGEARFILANQNAPGLNVAAFDMGDAATQEAPLVAVPGQGNSLAAMMSGWGGSFSGATNGMGTDIGIATSSRQYAEYLTDDIRLTHKLTVSAGFRYEQNIPVTERHNYLNYLDYNIPSPDVSQAPGYSNLTGGYVYNTPGHRHPYNTDWHDFGPRLGLAYQVSPKVVLRGGYGLFYGLSSGQVTGELADGYTATTPYIWSGDGGVTQSSPINNPFPGGIVPVTGSSLGAATTLGGEAYGPVPSWNLTPRIEQWSLSVERELPGNSVVEIAYSASHGYHMGDGIARAIDMVEPASDLAQGASLLTDVNNPLYPYYPASSAGQPLDSPTVPAFWLMGRFPQYYLFEGRPGPPMGKSFYNSLVFRFTRRMAKGLQFTAHYTYSSSISNSDTADDPNLDWLECAANVCGSNGDRARAQNWGDLQQEISPAVSDITNRFVADYVYELPWGRGRAFGSNWGRTLDAIAGGWKSGGVITIQSGPPIAPHLASWQLANNGGFRQRPDLVGNPNTKGPINSRLGELGESTYLNSSAFMQPPPFVFGSAPRFMSNARGPGWHTMDFSLFKQFYFTENRDRYLELRGEASNVFNTPIFGQPDSTYGDSTFGSISSQVNGPRSMLLTLKLYF